MDLSFPAYVPRFHMPINYNESQVQRRTKSRSRLYIRPFRTPGLSVPLLRSPDILREYTCLKLSIISGKIARSLVIQDVILVFKCPP